MVSRSLYVLLEGNDDERFFQRLLKPSLQMTYHKVRFWKYAREKRSRTLKFIRSLGKIGADFIFVRDIDSVPSVGLKKREIQESYDNAIPDQSIVVVVMEIEGWYMAGPDPDYLGHLGIPIREWSTDSLTKEMFNQLIPPRMSRIEFMNELLEHYDIDRGMRRNTSFSYFVEHWMRRRS